MHFLLVLFAYVVQRRFDLTIGQQLDNGFQQGQRRALTVLPAFAINGWLLYGMVVLVPTLLLVFTLWLAQNFLYGVFAVFLQLIVLFLVMGSALLKRQMDAYLEAWREERYQAAYHQVQPLGFRLNTGIEKPRQLHASVSRGFLYRSFSHYFSMIFWFMVAGAAGALLVRLSNQAAQRGETAELQKVAGKVAHLVEWVPARLLVLTFALAGNFSDCLKRCRASLTDPAAAASLVLSQAAEGALSSAEVASGGETKQSERDVLQVLSLRDLLNRSVLVWFAVLAVLVLAGYS